ncbi:MAG: hypothetical protein LWW93_05120 [Hyphomicrobiales bacterium]|nr:hypothetical protein [Hyphomicrobiales bacterium]
MTRRFAAIALSSFLFAAPVSAAETDLAPFLGGFLKACEMGRGFDAFHRSLAEKYGSTGDRSAKLSIPPAMASSIGAIEAKNLGEYTEVKVATTGVFKGFAVRRLDFALGNENGVTRWEVLFAASVADVRAKLGAEVGRSRTALQKKDVFETGADTGIDEKDGLASLWCDLSN